MSARKILNRLWIPEELEKRIFKSRVSRAVYFITAFACLVLLLAPSNFKSAAVFDTAYITFLADVSRSQMAEKPLGSKNRLQRSKDIVRSICDEYPDIRTSLYAFTGIARSHAYFSESPNNKQNCGYIKKTLENVLKLESVSKTDSNIADALLISAESFPAQAESRILILFTDGEYTNQNEEFIQAFATVKKRGITLLIVGVGEETGAYIPIYNESSGEIVDVERTHGGRKIVTALRPETLKSIARETNGKYFTETEKDKLFGEIQSNLIRREEPTKNFYSSWKLAPLAIFFLAGLLFWRKVL